MAESNEKVRANIYITHSLWNDMKDICRREGVSISGKFEDFLRYYVQAHSPGNPQLKISLYAKPEDPQPMRVLCNFVDGAISNGQIHCRQAGCWLPGVRCYSCDKNRLRKHAKNSL